MRKNKKAIISILGLSILFGGVSSVAFACTNKSQENKNNDQSNEEKIAKNQTNKTNTPSSKNDETKKQTSFDAKTEFNGNETEVTNTKTELDFKNNKKEENFKAQEQSDKQGSYNLKETSENNKNNENNGSINQNNLPQTKNEEKQDTNLKNNEEEKESKQLNNDEETSSNRDKQQTNERTDLKNNDIENTQKLNENEDSVEKLNNELKKYVKEAKEFIIKNLNGAEFEFSKDKLNDLIFKTIDFINYKNNDAKIVKEWLEKFKNNFNEVKQNYNLNAQTPPSNSEEVENNKKESNNSDTLDNYNINLQTNQVANQFMDMVNIDTILDIEHKGYTQDKKNLIKDFSLELVKDAKTDLEKTRLIFNWITSNVKYANDLSRMPEIEPYKVFTNKYAVCGGYSNLYKAMLDSIGIKNSVVIGWSKYGDHQWNLVYDSQTKKFFHSDPTWGKTYFKKTDTDFAKDHKTYKILETKIENNEVVYEYNYGVSVSFVKTNDAKILNNLGEVPVTRISSTYFNDKTTILNITQNIKEIDYIGGTNKLVEYKLNENNDYFSVVDGILFNKDKTVLLSVPKNHQLKSITIPKTTIKINDDKQSIESINLENIFVEYGNYWLSSYDGALYNNDFSKLVKIPNQKNKLKINSNTKLKSHDISFLDNLKEIYLNEGIESIEEFSFNSLKNIEIIHLPSTLSEINDQGFLNINRKVIFEVNKSNQNIIKKIEQLFSKENIKEY